MNKSFPFLGKNARIWVMTSLVFLLSVLLVASNQPFTGAAQALPEEGLQLTNPYVSEPVAPIDTTGLPRASVYNDVPAYTGLIRNAFDLPSALRTAENPLTPDHRSLHLNIQKLFLLAIKRINIHHYQISQVSRGQLS